MRTVVRDVTLLRQAFALLLEQRTGLRTVQAGSLAGLRARRLLEGDAGGLGGEWLRVINTSLT